MSSYKVSGPTQIGDTGQLNDIQGDVRLSDITTTYGDIVYANGSNDLQRLAPSTADFVLTTQAAGAAPVWKDVNSIVTGSSLSPVVSAVKSGAQAGITTVATTIASWSTAAPGFDDSGGAFNTATGVFTASVAGVYKLVCNIGFTNTSNAGDRVVDTFLNGVTVWNERSFQPTGSVASNQVTILNSLLSLGIGDTIQVRIYRSGGAGTITVLASPYTWIEIYRVHS